MPIIVPQLGKIQLLTKLLKEALVTDENYTLRLYQNDYTPDQTTVLANFTEATFPGYASKTLTRSGWDTPTTQNNKARSTYATQTFTCTGPTNGTIYGYYVIGVTSGVVLWAERFQSVKVLGTNESLNLMPGFTLNSEN